MQHYYGRAQGCANQEKPVFANRIRLWFTTGMLCLTLSGKLWMPAVALVLLALTG
jgi:hypothetical protein